MNSTVTFGLYFVGVYPLLSFSEFVNFLKECLKNGNVAVKRLLFRIYLAIWKHKFYYYTFALFTGKRSVLGRRQHVTNYTVEGICSKWSRIAVTLCRISISANSKQCIGCCDAAGGVLRAQRLNLLIYTACVPACSFRRRRRRDRGCDLTVGGSVTAHGADRPPAIAGEDHRTPRHGTATDPMTRTKSRASGGRFLPPGCSVAALLCSALRLGPRTARQCPTVNDRWFATIYSLTNNSTSREFPLVDVLLGLHTGAAIRARSFVFFMNRTGLKMHRA